MLFGIDGIWLLESLFWVLSIIGVDGLFGSRVGDGSECVSFSVLGLELSGSGLDSGVDWLPSGFIFGLISSTSLEIFSGVFGKTGCSGLSGKNCKVVEPW
ncbi:hypothetical protein VQY18_01755 [Mycoplasma feriruminatoris]|uniref:Uncharacterized protein n=1 Tax=Mycoplasma feriruminatoris TaxID=1179777 RepID=A0A654IMG4_9MOLU|nr:hypothetical protein MF5583_00357 [Mycoplasma feriruminatoris]